MKQALSRLAGFLINAGHRLGGAIRRHPWRAAAAVPLLMLLLPLLYVLALVPFTPAIGDLRKVKTQQPAVVLTADGKELAVFRRINRESTGYALARLRSRPMTVPGAGHPIGTCRPESRRRAKTTSGRRPPEALWRRSRENPQLRHRAASCFRGGG